MTKPKQDDANASPDLSKPAIELLQDGIFPKDWRFVPTHGKNTYVENWPERPLTIEDTIAAYNENTRYRGVGVVTGSSSGGLIALDVDGPGADERYKKVAGEDYQEYGKENTMSWTSGKPSRRQLLWRVPASLLPELRDIRTIIEQSKTGEWKLGQGDDAKKKLVGEKYEELVLRFNHCQSVLPGSPHPDTKQPYRFLQYNDGKPADAPSWVIDILMGLAKPIAWLSKEDLQGLKEDLEYKTAIPCNQIRGWFFSDTVQSALLPKLEDVIFNHSVFGKYGWITREGSNPQRLSGCPWHGGESGTAFQYAVQSGVWRCHACDVGGDVLDFVHKIESNDMTAPRPYGVELERYVAGISKALGFNYPDDARGTQKIVDSPRIEMTVVEFLEALDKICQEESNPAVRIGRMSDLAQDTGRRLSGAQCLNARNEYTKYKENLVANNDTWYDVEKMEFVVPGLLCKPSQVIIHGDAGQGKTSALMALAVAVGRGSPIRIRGIEVSVVQGKVLWIQNDQNRAKLLEDCEANGIRMPQDASWFIVKRGFQINYQQDLRNWINEIKPELVVIDSIGSCSTQVQIEEKDKAFATPFYDYATMNGDKEENGGFKSCSIIWVHHNNAKGEMRGTKYLSAAVDEVWNLRKLTEPEKDALRTPDRSGNNCRFLEIGKSRLGREGDLLVVERDENYSYSMFDYTPTERREDGGTGDPEPDSICLRILRDTAVENDFMDCALTAEEVHTELKYILNGIGKKVPVIQSVRRWLRRYLNQGLVVLGGTKAQGAKNKRTKTFTIPTPPSRAGCEETGSLIVEPSKSFRRSGLTANTSTNTDGDVRRSEAEEEPPESGQDAPGSTNPPEDGAEAVRRSNPVVAGPEADLRTRNNQKDTSRARPRQNGPTYGKESGGDDYDRAFGAP